MSCRLKQHHLDEFYYKRVRGGCYAVYDGYDRSMASLEDTEVNAIVKCAELNGMRNKRSN